MTMRTPQLEEGGAARRSGRAGVLARLGGWGAAHPWRAVGAWVLVLVLAFALGLVAVGAKYSSNNGIPGTESQRAIDLLARDFPSQAGDSDQIVIHVRSGSVRSAAVRARVIPMLAKVARVAHVSAVVSPYTTAGADAISRDGRTAFATVNFDKNADAIPVSAIKQVIATAQTIRSPGLEVGLGGGAIKNAQGISLSFATMIGVLAALVVLLLTFGSLIAAGMPIVTALFGLGTTFGLIALASRVIKMPDASTELAAMIGLGVGIDYALFIVTRFRESMHRGNGVHAAVEEAMDTAGRAVLLAGLTVIVALLGMLTLGVAFLSGLAVASAIGVLVMLLSSLTLLPALLGALGTRIARRRRSIGPRRGAGSAGASVPRAGLWLRWGQLVRRHPWPAALAGAAIMLVIAFPALSIRLGLTDAGNDPPGTTTRTAYDLLANGFGKGFNGPLLIVARLPRTGDQPAIRTIRATLKRAPGVASVSPAQLSSDRRTAVYQAFPVSSPQSAATTNLVNTLRQKLLPPAARATGATVLVSGATAVGIDFANVLSSKLPVFIAIVVLLGAAMLFVVFRSLVIPIQAAIMNVLSICAALGVTVLVFQNGWLGGLLGVTPGPIEPWLPVILFGVVFGLSMDYEVFLISRVHENWLKTGDASQSVVDTLGSTARVITAAATIMICVFASFILGSERIFKLFGISLASAVFLDAFVIRTLLLPAVLELLGRRTWWLPRWLDQRLPHLSIEPEPEPVPDRRPPDPALETGS
jgi:putative drug exporter of the RND superfamily